jgi:threonine aldolase
MAVGEAILFFNHALAEDFDYRCKQAGQLASKMRFLSAPWVGILENDAWLKYARHANHCAQLLAELVSDIPGVELMFPVQANGVFLQLSEPAIAALTAKGWRFYTFIGNGGARFMCSWDTEEERYGNWPGHTRSHVPLILPLAQQTRGASPSDGVVSQRTAGLRRYREQAPSHRHRRSPRHCS